MSQGKLSSAGAALGSTASSSSPAAGATTPGMTGEGLGLLGASYNKQASIGQFGSPMGVSTGVSAAVAPDSQAVATGPVPQGNGPVNPEDDHMITTTGY